MEVAECEARNGMPDSDDRPQSEKHGLVTHRERHLGMAAAECIRTL